MPPVNPDGNYKSWRHSLKKKTDKNLFVPFIAITETWLDSYISDAQINLNSYEVIRSDRKSRMGGGVLLYVNQKFPVSHTDTYDDGICQALSCVLTSEKLILLVFYRPPNASPISFSNGLSFVKSKIDGVPNDYQVVLSGDFNFPLIDWNHGTVLPGAPHDSMLSAHRLLDLSNATMMNQYVDCATRGRNILDLFFTSDPFLVVSVSEESTAMSDHNIIEVILSLQYEPCKSPIIENNSDGFRSLDFSRADIDHLSRCLDEIN